MKKTIMIAGILSILLLTGCTKTKTECFVYKDNTILQYDKTCGTKVNIPNEINGKPVLKIGDFAFMNMGLTKVTLPNKLETIGIGSFEINKLTKIKLPKTLKGIGANAFWQNKLTKLSIPESVTKIGTRVFNDNQLRAADAFVYGYTNNKLDRSILISYGGLANTVIIPDGVKVIERDALAYNQLTKVDLNEVEQIKSMALSNNNLKFIAIPKTVIRVDDRILMSNPIIKIIIMGKKDLKSFGIYREVDMVGNLTNRDDENTKVQYIFQK